MSTILLYTSPARGHLYPMMDVAIALRLAGHRVVVQTLAEERAAVEGAGVEHRPIHARVEELPLEDWKGQNPLDAMRRTMARWVERSPFEVEDLQASVAELKPQKLLLDVHTFGAAAFAESSGLPWACHLPYVLPVPSTSAPAFGPGFPPPAGMLGRARDRFVWWVQALAARGPLAPLNPLRASLGLPPIGSFVEFFTRPPVLFHRSGEPFEYPRQDWPTNHHAIGPGLWAPDAVAPAWLRDLPRPLTLVSVSTEHQDDAPIIQAAIAAFADMPGSTLITTAAQDPSAFATPHDRMRLSRFVSHAAIMDHVDLVVTHGGLGTTQRALAAGVPLVVVPWGRDQLETARRVEHCGAGVLLPRGKLSAESLRAAALRAGAMKPGAQRVAAAFAAMGGAAEVVRWAEA